MKSLIKVVSEVALDQEKQFDLIYIIVKVFIFKVRNAIVWLSIKTMRDTLCFLVDF